MLRLLFGGIMFVAGAFSALQAPINSALGKRTDVLFAVFVSFAVGTIALLAASVLSGQTAFAALREVPKWQLSGGLIGAIFVFSLTFFVSRLGAAGVVAAAVAGQLAGGMLIDRFGVAGLPQIAVTPSRLVGLLLLVAGGMLVTRH
jgi:transporter family-2 protein